MTRKRRQGRGGTHDANADICTPVAVYVVTPGGIARPAGSTDADAWRDLRDVGDRLGLPPRSGESRQDYALRLRDHLAQLDPRQSVGGAAVYMLRLIVDLEVQPPGRNERSGNPTKTSKDRP